MTKRIARATALVVLTGVMLVAALKMGRWLLDRETCFRKLCSVDLALQMYEWGSTGMCPDHLEDLGHYVDGALSCPGVHGLSRQTGCHSQRVDYIYVAYVRPIPSNSVPVVICPPINHGGWGGHVLTAEHDILWHGASEMDKIITEVYMRVRTNHCKVIVGPELERRSRGRYTSLSE